MCTGVLVCHGDAPAEMPGVFQKEHLKNLQKNNSPATFYITRDGQYAIHADFVSAEELKSGTLDLSKVPKIKLAQNVAVNPKTKLIR